MLKRGRRQSNPVHNHFKFDDITKRRTIKLRIQNFFETLLLTIIVRWEAKQTFLYDLMAYIALKAKALTTKFINLIAKI